MINSINIMLKRGIKISYIYIYILHLSLGDNEPSCPCRVLCDTLVSLLQYVWCDYQPLIRILQPVTSLCNNTEIDSS